MKTNIKNERLINLLMAIAFSLLILYLSRGLMGILTIVQFVPFIILLVNDGFGFWAAGLFATALGGYFLIDLTGLVINIVTNTVISLIAGIMIRKRFGIGQVVRSTSYTRYALLGLTIYLIYLISGQNPFDVIRADFGAYINRVKEGLELGLNYSQLDITNIINNLSETINRSIELLPALLFIYSYLVVFINVFISVKIMEQISGRKVYNTKLNTYYIGKGFKYMLILAFITVSLAYLFNLANVDLVRDNLILLFAFFSFCDGVLLVDAIYEFRMNKLFRFLLLFIFIVLLRAYIAFVIVGLIDIFVNVRERRLRNEK